MAVTHSSISNALATCFCCGTVSLLTTYYLIQPQILQALFKSQPSLCIESPWNRSHKICICTLVMWKVQSELRNSKPNAKQTPCKLTPKARRAPVRSSAEERGRALRGGIANQRQAAPASRPRPPHCGSPRSPPSAPRPLGTLTVVSPDLGRAFV